MAPMDAPQPGGRTPFAPKEPLETLLFESAAVGIGTFRCRADHPLFRDSGPSSTCCFVFPRSSVWIHHAGGRPFIADPRVVTYYNKGQEYSRRKLSADGDRGEWFALAPQIAAEIVATIAPGRAGRGRRVFTWSHGPAEPATYLRQRQLVQTLSAGSSADPVLVEESVLSLLARNVRLAAGTRRISSAPAITTRQRDLVEDCKRLIAANVANRMHLSAIAAQLSCSVFHLCRTFRSLEGIPIHAYQQDLRLRLALERIPGAESDLARVALDLGFCSHSHFTAAFRRQFGTTPSAFARTFRA